MHPAAARQGVLPMALGGGIHHEQVAIGEFHGQGPGPGGGLVGAGAEAQGAAGAEAEGGDRRLGHQLRLVIGVPAHGVIAIAVAVGENGIEGTAQMGLQQGAQALQGRSPREGLVLLAAVAVGATGISKPAAEPGGGVLAAVEAQQGLLPGQGLAQVGLEGLGCQIGGWGNLQEPGGPVAQGKARGLQVLGREAGHTMEIC